MPYHLAALLSVIVFSLVHLFGDKIGKLNREAHGRFLSAGGGIAIAYVFVDLLPKLARSDLLVRQALQGWFPYFERHVYVMALLGFLLFFIVGQTPTLFSKKRQFWISMTSYALFNFLVGYAVVDKDNPEVRPLFLFTFAIALHYFSNDFSLEEAYGEVYRHLGKWLLIVALFLGWIAGAVVTLPPTVIALVSAFIGGGVIMNVTRHELPEENPHSLGAFLLSTLLYATILLAIG